VIVDRDLFGEVTAAVVRPAEDLAELMAVAQAEHEAGQRGEQMTLEHYRKAGEALVRAKAAAGHGRWLPALEKTGIPQQRASEYMRLAEGWGKLPPGGTFTLKEALRLIGATEAQGGAGANGVAPEPMTATAQPPAWPAPATPTVRQTMSQTPAPAGQGRHDQPPARPAPATPSETTSTPMPAAVTSTSTARSPAKRRPQSPAATSTSEVAPTEAAQAASAPAAETSPRAATSSPPLPDRDNDRLGGLSAKERARRVNSFLSRLNEAERAEAIRLFVAHPRPGESKYGGDFRPDPLRELEWLGGYEQQPFAAAKFVTASLLGDQARRWRVFWMRLATAPRTETIDLDTSLIDSLEYMVERDDEAARQGGAGGISAGE
jgi:hypothetical protein